ncbi:MAG: adenosylmethionine decarboxylase [Neomegalonema sp.]|nr:adenosylmethionine decarboxylase [Neomegalonema sp.]
MLGWGAEVDTVDQPRRETKAPKSNHHPQDAALEAEDLSGNTDDDHFIRRDGKVFAGTHLIIEVVDGDGLDDAGRIERAFRDCVEQCGATLLHLHLHRFTPQGVSGVAVLAESHISVHTWPERRYGAFDVFMCGDADPHRAVPVLKDAFSAGDVRVTELLRGDGIV